MTHQQNEFENIENIGETLSKPKKSKAKKVLIIILCGFLSLIILLIGTFFILAQIGKKKLHKNEGIKVENAEVEIIDDNVISYNDAEYKINENIVSVLFIGVDKKKNKQSNAIGKNGQADTVFLACLDTKEKTVEIIPIPRDCMVDVDHYSVDGNFAGTKQAQICLSFAYGSDSQSGCENVKKSVSRLLCGVNISSFVAVDLDGISAMTQAVGGVTLTSLETVGNFKKGEKVTLNGKTAKQYVQLRGKDVDASNRRFARQKQFLSAFASTAGNKVLENFTRLTTYYNTAVPYITTDLDISEVTYLAQTCLTADMGNSIKYLSISGETVMGEKNVEFYPDENSVYEAVLDAFYIKVK